MDDRALSTEAHSAAAVTTEHVSAAARLAALPLTAQESRDVADLLGQWIPAAVALSTRMQAPDLDGLTPITAFASHEVPQEGERP
jgi:hypothetical protein